MTYSVLQLDDVERIEAGGAGWWRPIRRTLGVTAFGVNAYTADATGDALIETHDETSFGAGRHEELYVVVSGEAAFTVAGTRSPRRPGRCCSSRPAPSGAPWRPRPPRPCS